MNSIKSLHTSTYNCKVFLLSAIERNRARQSTDFSNKWKELQKGHSPSFYFTCKYLHFLLLLYIYYFYYYFDFQTCSFTPSLLDQAEEPSWYKELLKLPYMVGWSGDMSHRVLSQNKSGSGTISVTTWKQGWGQSSPSAGNLWCIESCQRGHDDAWVLKGTSSAPGTALQGLRDTLDNSAPKK